MTAGSRPRTATPATTETREPTRRFVSSRPELQPASRLNGAIVFTIAAALVAAVGMLYLLQTNHVANLGYEMSRLQQVQKEQAVENQRLKSELAGYRTLGHVRTVAVHELGMKPLDERVFLSISRPERVDVAVPPPVERQPKPLWERFWDRLTGHGSAVNESDREAQQ